MNYKKNNDIVDKILESWSSINLNYDYTKKILEWVDCLNKKTTVNIKKIDLKDSNYWFYDKINGLIRNRNNSFFQVAGIRQYQEESILKEQPILIQDEIGYLGIICKEIDGVLNFLIQAKIEPGNINHIQLSPTIQATKSNFKMMHGGKTPKYLEYFLDTNHKIIVDQIQSEQSSRFLGKRNRNIVIIVDEEIEIQKNFMFMTLAQIKELMKYDNLVNMDTRTVISCLPIFSNFDTREYKKYFVDKSFYKSMYDSNIGSVEIFNYINDVKMHSNIQKKIVPLYSLKEWEYVDGEYVNKNGYSFKMIFCDIEIEGREVGNWNQPLFEATNQALFGLFTCVHNGIRLFLVCCKEEIGCFDNVEVGPTVQWDYDNKTSNLIEEMFWIYLNKEYGIIYDVILSEEGGRFYHEQNRNVIIELNNKIENLPKGYFWIDYSTLNEMIKYNNILNIQLRNLLSLMRI